MRIIALTFAITLLISCENENATAILGSWQCTEILEEGEPLELDASVINFSFDEKNQYTYQGTLTYKEAGSYRLVGDKLYTTDTIDATAVEKVVKITLLTADSMNFKMNAAGKERILKLARQ